MTDDELKALVGSLAVAQKETDLQIKEIAEQQKETDRQLREQLKETNQHQRCQVLLFVNLFNPFLMDHTQKVSGLAF